MTSHPSPVPGRLRLPRWPFTPLLAVAVTGITIAGCILLRQQTGWPGLSLLSSAGHGLTAGLQAIIACNSLVCRREARCLELGEVQASAWLQRARQMGPHDPRIVSALRGEASARWALQFLMGCALVPLGLIASLEQLPPPSQAISTELRPYLPLGLALLEAVVVVLAAHALDALWQDFVTSWICSHPPQPQPEVSTPMPQEETDALEDLFASTEAKPSPAVATPQPASVEDPVEHGEAGTRAFWWPTVK